MMRLEGKTAANRRVSILLAGRQAREIRIDGEEAKVLRDGTMRDGGTREIETDRGKLVLWRRMGQEPKDLLDGEELEPIQHH